MESVPEDSQAREVEALEAREIATQRVAELQNETYQNLVADYLDRSVHNDIAGATGTTYDVEVQAFWEDSRKPGTLLVRVTVDWPLRGLRHLAIRDFLIGSDGNVVGEHEPEWFRVLDNVRHPVRSFFYLGVGFSLLELLGSWILRGQIGNFSATKALVIAWGTAASFPILYGVRRWWVRRRLASQSPRSGPQR
jgi:hypothetical protein